jgi:flagellar biosynthetic protein FlhB
MMADVPAATFIVANPTHYSVAVRYQSGVDIAPVVVAKGKDLIALKIREIGKENGVPVVESKSLARALYTAVEVSQMIPAEFYHAVAELLHFVYGLENRPNDE